MMDRSMKKSPVGCCEEQQLKIWKEKWRGQHVVVLENKRMRVTILPALGGKLASVILKREKYPDFELAAQPERFAYRIPERDTKFAACDASGIDDAFPTIDPGILPGEAGRFSYTDHGEIWRSSFSSDICGDSLVLEYKSEENSFFYRKRVLLLEQGIRLQWRILNTGDVPFPFLWTMHGLVRYEEDMELLYPEEIRSFLNVLDGPELGEAGAEHPTGKERMSGTENNTWAKDPTGVRVPDAEAWDFHRVPSADSVTQLKYYAAGKVKSGWCGYFYPGSEVRCTLRYDAEKLPWLGMWITAGGFRGDYNCAWEPSTGFYDGVEQALHTDTLRVLRPGEEFEFWAEYDLETCHEHCH
ncbi:MAG: hypothetical protein LIO94_13015 [Clostridiales bacterium]|nr:hypothetical protein [Clostridiales bacterium]